MNANGQTEAKMNTPQLIAVGGGKGGVGKTMISSSIALGLASLKKKVTVIDLDLGGANLHAVFGMDKPDKTYLDFYNKESKELSDIQIIHPLFDNLNIICGASGSLGMANIPFSHKMKLMRHLKKLDADYVVMDLGAGTSYNVIDFFLAADQGIVVITPDSLSIIDSYNFIKQAFYRKLMLKFRMQQEIVTLITDAAKAETYQTQTSVEMLIRKIKEINPDLSQEISDVLKDFKPGLMINRLDRKTDEADCLSVKIAAKDLLSIDVTYLGAIHEDKAVLQSLQDHLPFLQHDAKSKASKDLVSILSKKILKENMVESIRHKQLVVSEIKIKDKEDKQENKTIICSVDCYYWEVCEFRNGGYPCELGGL